MGEKITLGFHSAVDFELKWDAGVIETLASKYDIRKHELKTDFPVKTERDMIIAILGHLTEGTGGEYVPETNLLCKEFASHFKYEQTIGGTATRAAIALSKLGLESKLSMCCYNEVIRTLLPDEIHQFPNVKELDDEIYPHVILSYPGGVRVRANDIEITTPRENRVMFSNDAAAINMEVSGEFASEMTDAKVFLLGCFSEVLDFDILKDRMEKTNYLLENLAPDAWAILEDGCYINKEFRYYVHKSLGSRLNVLSMNEDEMQEFLGEKIDILDARSMQDALRHVYKRINISVLVVHSAYWALAYGEEPEKLKQALLGGICLSATRFRYGDSFGKEEYAETEKLPDKEEGVRFCREIKEKLGEHIFCLPTKDLSFVENPTVVGLGDFFAGGLLTGVLDVSP
ncbi:MAG: ADP-dependent glucokinase/phosphofructokinase [Lachnospiraceae bacterium]